LKHCLALKAKAQFEMSATVYQSTWCNITEDFDLPTNTDKFKFYPANVKKTVDYRFVTANGKVSTQKDLLASQYALPQTPAKCVT
jgi:hypothetical protein